MLKANTNDGNMGLTNNTELKRKRAFRKFSYRGVDLDQYVSAKPASLDCARHITKDFGDILTPQQAARPRL